MDFEQPRLHSGGFSAFGDHLSDLCLLLRRKLWTPTTNPAFLAGSIQSRFGSFLEYGLFKLSKGPDHLRVWTFHSAKAPTICIIMRPAGVVVSIASVKLRNPAPASPRRSMMMSTSRRDRESRSSFHTTSTSSFR